ncbi:hypothetical protein BDR06DRAFT_350517 [Suillus hirtellus]|nr:hypothetical protein BDR06DRAFT_350517 [Suillus hirtellus]
MHSSAGRAYSSALNPTPMRKSNSQNYIRNYANYTNAPIGYISFRWATVITTTNNHSEFKLHHHHSRQCLLSYRLNLTRPSINVLNILVTAQFFRQLQKAVDGPRHVFFDDCNTRRSACCRLSKSKLIQCRHFGQPGQTLQLQYVVEFRQPARNRAKQTDKISVKIGRAGTLREYCKIRSFVKMYLNPRIKMPVESDGSLLSPSHHQGYP